MGSGISRQIRDGIWKWDIVSPDDPDQDNGTKLLNYCIAIGPGQVPLRGGSIQLIWRRVGPPFASSATCRGVEAKASMTDHLDATVLLLSSALIDGKVAFAFNRLPTAASEHMQRTSVTYGRK
ncbi:hypothetical protein TNCV_957461 [Trichonephila clavipes]|nr:hypothetical protein TNCV_957461 [Trichonephila clavipes]